MDDKNGKYIHDWIVESEIGKGDYMFIPKSERHKCEGINKIVSNSEPIRMVDLGDTAIRCGFEPTLENCNHIAYLLDEQEGIL